MPTLNIAKTIVKKLSDAGHTTYFAGGWVRDFLMQRPSDDIDIATSASVEEIQQLFPKTIPVGIAFGIVIIALEGHHFEVATFRKESDYLDGRRPSSIQKATPEEDAERRDFTINGLFYDPLSDTILDFVGGQRDIQQGVIRAIGDPHKRFLEDRLRMIRAVRYSSRFNFLIEENTLQAIRAHAENLFPSVAIERVWQEFKKMSKFAHFATGLATLHELHLLPTIFPTLKDVSLEEIQKRLQAIPYFPKEAPTIAEMLELFPKISLDDLLKLCEYLKLSREERKFAVFLLHTYTLLCMPKEWLATLESIEWAQFYAHPYADLSLEIFAARFTSEEKKLFLDAHTKKKELLSKSIARIRTKNPLIRSEHLKKEGIPSGKKMGLLLTEAERISTNLGLEDPEEVLKKLKALSLWSAP